MTRELTKDDVGKTFKDHFDDRWEVVAVSNRGPWPVVARGGDCCARLFDLRGNMKDGIPQRRLIIEDPPREVWINFYPYGWPPVAHKTKEKADEAAESDRIGPAVLFREVKES